MRKHLTLSVALLTMASTCLGPALAQEARVGERAALYLDMPRYIETYLVQLMRPFRKAAGDDQILTQDEVDDDAQAAEARRRSQIMGPFFSADLDGDLSVTRAEWQKTQAGQPRGRGGDQFLTWDADKNGVVTIEEITPSQRNLPLVSAGTIRLS